MWSEVYQFDTTSFIGPVNLIKLQPDSQRVR